MGRTTTILLLVGISGIIVYLFMREKKATGAQAGTSYNIDLGKAITAFGGLFSKGDKAAAPGYVTSTDTQGQAAYALSHGVVEQQGNQLIDLNTGNALVYGTD